MTGFLILTVMIVALAVALIPAHRRALTQPPHRTGLPSALDDFRADEELRQLTQLRVSGR